MKRQFKKIAIVVATVAVSLHTVPAQACGGRGGGGGFRGGFSGGFGGYSGSVSRAPISHARSYSSYSQPAYSQPVYSQPSYTRPSYSQPSYYQPAPTQSASLVRSNQVIRNTTRQSQIVGQPQVGQTAGQPQTQFGQQRQQQSIQQASTRSSAPTQATGRTVSNKVASQPEVNKTNSPAPTANNSSPTSALQMLASLNVDEAPQTQSPQTEVANQIPEFTAAASQTVGEHVGIWKVNLPGAQSVALELDEEGKFRWTAEKNGKSSSFQGQYRLENGRLTLVRENDLQQMAGNWNGEGNKFTFKLDGATTSGLAFQKS